MGSHISYCGKNSKNHVLDIKRHNEVNGSRQTFDTFNDSTIYQKDFHSHQSDFIRKVSTEITEEYELQDELGVGSYGKVLRAIDKRTGQVRAIKVVAKSSISPKDKNQLMEEVRLLSNLDHPNIVKLYELVEDSKNFYIISELLTGGELFDRILQKDHLTEQGAACIMYQVLSAVAYCHKFGVVHRDLKPENILFDTLNDDTVKVIDFGLAQAFKHNQRMHGVIGTAYYIAPEILNNEGYTERCDLWSCGVILYIMLSGYSPFAGQKSSEIFEEVKKGDFDFDKPIWNTISHSAKKLIKRMMEYNPNKRITAEQALADPWFAEHYQRKSVNKPLASDALQRLHSFRSGTKFQEAIWVYLVNYFSSKNDMHKLTETFRMLDRNNDGQLGKDEMKAAYVQIMGMSDEVAEHEAEKIFNELDYDHDGKINYSEFISAATSRKMLLTKDKLESAFRMIDKNHDGKIQASELKNLFSDERIQRLPSNTWNEWIEQVAQNRDGTVTLDQFEKMMLSLYAGQEGIEPAGMC